jgi:hypothetical protein
MKIAAPLAVFLPLTLGAVAACDFKRSKATSAAIQKDTVNIALPTPQEEQEDAMRGIFHARSPCASEIKITGPYAVVSDGWGNWVIRGALEALDHKEASLADENTDPQLTFDIGNVRYRLDGVRYWIKAQTTGNLRGTAKPSLPGHDLPSGYQSWATHIIDHGVISPNDYYYLSADQTIALECSPRQKELPNPTCVADVEDKTGRFLFSIRFPIKASRRVDDLAAAGLIIFKPVWDRCTSKRGQKT